MKIKQSLKKSSPMKIIQTPNPNLHTGFRGDDPPKQWMQLPSGRIIRKFSGGPYGEWGARAYNGGLGAEPELRGPGPP